MFESKPIKKKGKKTHFDSSKKLLEFSKHLYKQISSQISNNNNNNYYTTIPAFSNLYISKRLNNMDQAQVMKRERED